MSRFFVRSAIARQSSTSKSGNESDCYRGIVALLVKSLGIALFFPLIIAGCGKQEHRFESVCQIVRKDIVEKDDKGEAEILDVELEWDPCPGDQFQVVRGGRDFAACMKDAEVGSLVPVQVKHWWDDRGYFTWDVYKIGNCAREIEANSEGSYEKSQECSDEVMYGRTAGVSCSRRPFKQLVQVCPWMARQ
jgi:hypothetical protein